MLTCYVTHAYHFFHNITCYNAVGKSVCSTIECLGSLSDNIIDVCRWYHG